MKEIETVEEIFSNGSTWLKVDFHLHTKSDKEFKYSGQENDFTKSYVDQLISNDINIGVITNHNKFDLDEFKALRKRARKSNILLLAGVELSINDGANGVHTLIVFSDAWIENSNDHINPFLSSVFSGKSPQQYENENGRTSEVGIKSILSKLKEFDKDFFVVFAHVEQRSGLWKELDGGRISELSEEPLVQEYCLGFQKVRTHDNGEKNRVKIQNWWNAEYPAEVEGSDPKSLEDIGKGTKHTFVKIGAPTFEALKYALMDHKARVSERKFIPQHSYISKISFDGGLFGGQSISLSPNMNTMIGIRGSGKSAIIETIRYALGIEGEGVGEDKKYKENLISHILGSGGKITLELVDSQGKKYQVTRIHRETPKCYMDGELLDRIDPKSVILKRPMYFGQKDLAKAGENLGGNSLIEKMLGNELVSERNEIVQQEQALGEAIKTLLSISQKEDELEAKKERLETVKFQINKLDSHGVDTKLANEQELLADKTSAEQLASNARTIHKSALDAASSAKNGILEAPKHRSDTNKEAFADIASCRQNIIDLLDKQIELLGEVDSETNRLQEFSTSVAKAFDDKKEEFAEVQRQITAELAKQGQTGLDISKYAELKVTKARLEGEIATLEQHIGSASEVKSKVSSDLDVLETARLKEFKSTEKLLNQLNESQDAIKIASEFRGDRDAFLEKLKEVFKGSGITQANFSKLVETYADFTAIYRDIENASKLLGAKSATFRDGFNNSLTELLTYQVPNTFEVNFHGRPLEDHSLGQRASAMMIFLLSQKDGDVIIVDQPEDDLDNQTIYEDVIKIIREIKSDKQFIFATHNANFPVLGDAEVVVACEETGGKFTLSTNSVDDKNCQSRIIKVMEGGREAFSKRRQIYQQWEG